MGLEETTRTGIAIFQGLGKLRQRYIAVFMVA
jgi:hypothetical protein